MYGHRKVWLTNKMLAIQQCLNKETYKLYIKVGSGKLDLRFY